MLRTGALNVFLDSLRYLRYFSLSLDDVAAKMQVKEAEGDQSGAIGG